MCSSEEIFDRMLLGTMHVRPPASVFYLVAHQDLEKNPSNQADTSLVIKRYDTRTSRGERSCQLRNRRGISLSMDRLRVVMNFEEVPFEKRVEFICDRYRAIAKDMLIQLWQVRQRSYTYQWNNCSERPFIVLPVFFLNS